MKNKSIVIALTAVALVAAAVIGIVIVQKGNTNGNPDATSVAIETTSPPDSGADITSEDIQPVVDPSDTTVSPGDDTQAQTPDDTTSAEPADSSAYPDVTTTPEDATTPDDTTASPDESLTPDDTTVSPEDTNTPDDTSVEASDTTTPDTTTTPDDTTAEPVVTTEPEVTTAEPVCDHAGTIVVTKKAVAATCTSAGCTEERQCSKCKLVLQYSEEIPKLDHTKAYTPNKDGTHTVTCTKCKATLATAEKCSGGSATCTAKAQCSCCHYEYGSLAAHSYTKKTTTAAYLKSAADCTNKATYYYACATCGAVGTKTYTSGSALGHVKAYTPNGDGTHTVKCTRCNTVIATAEACSGGTATCIAKAQCSCCHAEYGEYGTHTASDWIVDKKSTDDEDGEKHTECTVCKAVLSTEVIPKGTCTEHTWVFDHYGVHNTLIYCIRRDGSTYYKCANCGEIRKEKGCASHDISDGSLVKTGEFIEPTCTTRGGYVIQCPICGYEDIERTTMVAQLVISSVGHSYGDWETVTTAHDTYLGIEQCTCTRCGFVQKRQVDADGNIYGIAHQWPSSTAAMCRDFYIEGETQTYAYSIKDNRLCAYDNEYMARAFLDENNFLTVYWKTEDGVEHTYRVAYKWWENATKKYVTYTFWINDDDVDGTFHTGLVPLM